MNWTTISCAFFLTASQAAADPLTFSFEGKVGAGWLDTQGLSSGGIGGPGGYSYNGLVGIVDGTFSANYALSETLSTGAVGRLVARNGAPSRYARLDNESISPGVRFDDVSVDFAAYFEAGPVLLTYGEMESSFGLSTFSVAGGKSILTADGAVLMNVGAGRGLLDYQGGSPTFNNVPKDVEYQTARVDVRLGDFVISRSNSITGRGDADSWGATWSKDLGELSIDVGLGFENSTSKSSGAQIDFRSKSASLEFRGFKFTVTNIHASTSSCCSDISYIGKSVSYEFGPLDLGVAVADQTNPISVIGPPPQDELEGEARAFWVGWDINEASRLDFEYSKSDFKRGVDVESLSVAFSHKF